MMSDLERRSYLVYFVVALIGWIATAAAYARGTKIVSVRIGGSDDRFQND
jgi:hypothetical protein